MADRPMFSPENIQTVTAVTFVLALLSLGLHFVTYSQLKAVAGALGASERAATAAVEQVDTLQKRVVALEKELAQSRTAPTPPP